MPLSLYLDCCALQRPFDDRSQLRVATEAEAVLKLTDSSHICARFSGKIKIMSHQVKTLYEVSSEARHVLYQGLGVANTVRFFNQFKTGEGNYTEERDATCGGATVDEIADMIRKSESPRHVG